MSTAGIRLSVLRTAKPILIAMCVAGLVGSAALSRTSAGTTAVSTPSKASELLGQKPQLTAGSFELDGRTNSLLLTDVRISTQTGYIIQAGEARTGDANNFTNSHWTFKNKVEITTPQGHTSAETANVSFAQNQISELHMEGMPAKFEQYDANKQTIARGQAGAIDYDLKQNTVRLSNDAWIKYGQNECRAVTLSYNIAAQRVSASKEEQNGQRVNCTLAPSSVNSSTAESNSAAPPSNNAGSTAASDTP